MVYLEQEDTSQNSTSMELSGLAHEKARTEVPCVTDPDKGYRQETKMIPLGIQQLTVCSSSTSSPDADAVRDLEANCFGLPIYQFTLSGELYVNQSLVAVMEVPCVV